jgi:hypothetical protein
MFVLVLGAWLMLGCIVALLLSWRTIRPRRGRTPNGGASVVPASPEQR